jgi:hypothetical protein
VPLESSDGSSRRNAIDEAKLRGLKGYLDPYNIIFSDLRHFIHKRKEAVEACKLWRVPLITPMLQYAARSSRDLYSLYDELSREKLRFIVLRFGRKSLDSVDMSNLTLSDIIEAFAEFESDLARERTFKATNASKDAVNTGKPPVKDEIKDAVVQAHASGLYSAKQLAKRHDLGLSTIYRIVKEAK